MQETYKDKILRIRSRAGETVEQGRSMPLTTFHASVDGKDLPKAMVDELLEPFARTKEQGMVILRRLVDEGKI